VVTNSKGLAETFLELPTTVANITVTASSSGLKNVGFSEYSVAGPAAQVTVSGGNNQSAAPGTTLPQALSVVVADQYGNPVSGASVSFTDNGAGGTFSANPVTTSSSGVASTSYTLPSAAGGITIDASVAGVTNPGVFTETSN